MIVRAEIKPELLRWACERSGLNVDAFTGRFPKLRSWIQGESQPTLKQVEAFAKATRTPVGYLFLPQPPTLQLPIPDLRTIGNKRFDRPSPDLLETVYICQQRQEWYRNFARSEGFEPLGFVGSVRFGDDVVETAAKIRGALGFDLEERRRLSAWTDAFRRFVEQAEELGVLVMVSGVVGNNSWRKLDPQEFRGFALADDLAPLAFVNNSDTEAAKMFTLAHELVHLWVGQTALSDLDPVLAPSGRLEVWCNQVAAELLVPLDVLREEYREGPDLHSEMSRLSRRFKVSTLVILRRIHDAGGINRQEFRDEYRVELERLTGAPVRGGGGGDFYATEAVRVSRRFARALVVSTLEGRTLFRDAFRLLAISNVNTLQNLGRRMGVI